MKFRKKPVVIEAEQFTKERGEAHILDKAPLPAGVVCARADWNTHERSVYSSWFTITTLEGVMTVESGDWVITGVKGERYPCKPDIFEMTYERVDQSESVDR